jgi:sRNA-binding carbon storage regulator CsrA
MKVVEPRKRLEGLKVSLRLGDGLVFNTDLIKVQVISIDGNFVRLAILADKDRFRIDRVEQNLLLKD